MSTQPIHTISRALFFLGALLFICILLLTIANISMRAFDSSVRGAVELSGYLGAAALGLCLPWIQLQKAHANAGIFCHHLPSVLQSMLHGFVTLLCFSITFACTRELADLALFMHEGMEVIDGFDIPSAFFVAALTLGCGGQCLVLCLDIVELLQKFGQTLRKYTSATPTLAYKGK